MSFIATSTMLAELDTVSAAPLSHLPIVKENLTMMYAANTNIFFLDILVGLIMGISVRHNSGGFVKNKFYAGSRILQPLTDLTAIPVDQLNLIISSFVVMLLGLFMRYFLRPSRFSVILRALTEIFFSVIVISFCFGSQLRVLILQSVVAYFALLFCRRDSSRTAVGVTAWLLIYLMIVHLCRLYYDYEGYTLDISGPLMLQTQRLSSLAFNLYDGARLNNYNVNCLAIKNGHPKNGIKKSATPTQNSTDNKLSPGSLAEVISSPKMMPSSHEYAIKDLPSPVEFAAYSIYFHGVCIGPFVFYRDYLNYLQGYSLGELPPINKRRLFYLFIRLGAYGVFYASLFQRFPIKFIVEDAFQDLSLFYRIGYISCAFILARHKYYFAWSLAEIMGMCAGNGYSGDDPETKESLWTNVHNFDFFKIETALNMKMLVDAWNIGTVRWLREVVYFRSPFQIRTITVFVVSAFWHGLYPGYYLMFLTFALFIFAARIWRRHIRSRFPVNSRLFLAYDAVTMVMTHLCMDYAQAPFHLLGLKPSYIIWRQFLFIPHIIAVTIIGLSFLFPLHRPVPETAVVDSKQTVA